MRFVSQANSIEIQKSIPGGNQPTTDASKDTVESIDPPDRIQRSNSSFVRSFVRSFVCRVVVLCCRLVHDGSNGVLLVPTVALSCDTEQQNGHTAHFRS